MLSTDQVLSSTRHYKQAFEEGLTDILLSRTAGTFILACANIIQHPELLEKNSKLLREVYTDIEDHYRICRSNNQQPDDSADDITVMDKIIDIGLDNLEPLQSRQLDTDTATYQLSFNQLRSFRPERMSTVKDIQINTEFNPNGFHFHKPFLKKEIFSEGVFNGKNISFFYNKFPFVKYHALLVANKEQHNNQYLSKEYLNYIFSFQAHVQKNIPAAVTAYNTLGAGASVNHLHFQIFIEDRPLPVFSESFLHNGGSHPYPATCHAFADTEKCWHFIQKLYTDNVPFNLLFKNKRIYCLPRNIVTNKHHQFNTTTCGWSEMAGAFTMTNKDIFESITVDNLIDTIRDLAAPF